MSSDDLLKQQSCTHLQELNLPLGNSIPGLFQDGVEVLGGLRAPLTRILFATERVKGDLIDVTVFGTVAQGDELAAAVQVTEAAGFEQAKEASCIS